MRTLNEQCYRQRPRRSLNGPSSHSPVVLMAPGSIDESRIHARPCFTHCLNDVEQHRRSVVRQRIVAAKPPQSSKASRRPLSSPSTSSPPASQPLLTGLTDHCHEPPNQPPPDTIPNAALPSLPSPPAPASPRHRPKLPPPSAHHFRPGHNIPQHAARSQVARDSRARAAFSRIGAV